MNATLQLSQSPALQLPSSPARFGNLIFQVYSKLTLNFELQNLNHKLPLMHEWIIWRDILGFSLIVLALLAFNGPLDAAVRINTDYSDYRGFTACTFSSSPPRQFSSSFWKPNLPALLNIKLWTLNFEPYLPLMHEWIVWRDILGWTRMFVRLLTK